MEKFQQVWLLLKNFGQTILVFFESILKVIANFYLNIIDYILNFFNLFFQFVANFWEQFNPSLFQNVILGVLIIYVFIAEYVAREIKEQETRKLSAMLATNEILNFKYMLIAIIALILFASWNEDTIHINKAIVFFLLLGFIYFLFIPILKFKKFFQGKPYKQETLFLKGLKFSKIFRSKNETKQKDMKQAWQFVWSENNKYEREFTDIFIKHIDNAIKFKKLYFATKLFGIYLENLQKRIDSSWIGYTILPKILEWDEKFWKEITNQDNSRKKIEDFFSKKYISKFKDFALKLHRKKNRDKDGWWKGYYFRNECLPEIIKKLLKNKSYLLFSSFKYHIQKMENKLSKIKNKDYRKNYNNCIHLIFII